MGKTLPPCRWGKTGDQQGQHKTQQLPQNKQALALSLGFENIAECLVGSHFMLAKTQPQ
jgi:hypothetical protein